MDKIKEMGEGIVVEDPPVHKTTKDGLMARGKRSATAGNTMHFFNKADYQEQFRLTQDEDFTPNICTTIIL